MSEERTQYKARRPDINHLINPPVVEYQCVACSAHAAAMLGAHSIAHKLCHSCYSTAKRLTNIKARIRREGWTISGNSTTGYIVSQRGDKRRFTLEELCDWAGFKEARG